MGKLSNAMPINSETEKERFLSVFMQLDPEQEWEAAISPIEKNRNQAQNRLMWDWNNVVSKDQGSKVEWVHGYSKLTYLLPLMKTWTDKTLARAEFVEDVLHQVPLYKHKVGVAYDMIRTRDLTVKQFSIYLDSFNQSWSAKGVYLKTSADYYYEAMGIIK